MKKPGLRFWCHIFLALLNGAIFVHAIIDLDPIAILWAFFLTGSLAVAVDAVWPDPRKE